MALTKRAIGLMSGTSMDGIDAAVLETDGVNILRQLGAISLNYEAGFRARLARAMTDARHLTQRNERPSSLASVERDVTQQHALAVRQLLEHCDMRPDQIDVIGFHGQTVLHRPEQGLTVQLGDGAQLARMTGIDVVHDLRAADIAGGGQGAPLVPVYHRAIASSIPQRPIAFVNIGGVANITYIDGPPADPMKDDHDDLIAFDTGPGNALLDDWALKHLGEPLDRDGALGARGTINKPALDALLRHDYFTMPAPKSLDRNAFSAAPVAELSATDGAATLTAFTAQTITEAVKFLPRTPALWVICGGGRLNPTLMTMMSERADGNVIGAEMIGLDGDHLDGDHLDGDQIEAQCFAYLAVRSLAGLAITFPMTTGIAQPMTGGVFSPAPK